MPPAIHLERPGATSERTDVAQTARPPQRVPIWIRAESLPRPGCRATGPAPARMDVARRAQTARPPQRVSVWIRAEALSQPGRRVAGPAWQGQVRARAMPGYHWPPYQPHRSIRLAREQGSWESAPPDPSRSSARRTGRYALVVAKDQAPIWKPAAKESARPRSASLRARDRAPTVSARSAQLRRPVEPARARSKRRPWLPQHRCSPARRSRESHQ